MKKRQIPFMLLAVMTLVLIAATLVEKTQGTAFVAEHVYGSWWFSAFWAVIAVTGMSVVLRSKLQRKPAAFLLHVSFVVILIGALVTHLFGEQGIVHLRQGERQQSFALQHSWKLRPLPFSLTLKGFSVENYPGTQSPMDYVSVVAIQEDGSGSQDASSQEMQISMNHIGSYKGYRFYQSGYDEDRLGTMLAVSHDPWGIGITYVGYGLLFLSFLWLLLLQFKSIKKEKRVDVKPEVGSSSSTKGRKWKLAAVVIVLAALFAAFLSPSFLKSNPKTAPKTLPASVAAKMGDLHVYYNGRICPLQTVAKDFTMKLHGKTTYQGLTAEQVFAGWVFFPTEWVKEPFIKVKGAAKERVGARGGYVSYSDFHGATGYKLDGTLADIRSGRQVDDARSITEADEKMNILLMLFNGQFMKIFPRQDGNTLQWYSPGDSLPKDMPEEEYMFIRKSMDYASELAWMNRYDDLSELLSKLKEFQTKAMAKTGTMAEMERVFQAEKLYNSSDYTRPLAMALATLGIVTFILFLICELRRKRVSRWVIAAMNIVLTTVLLYLLFFISLRGYVSGHLPLSNGYETMQFMSLCTVAFTLLLQRRYLLAIPFGILLTGLTLLVAMMGGNNPQITLLMPVLSSPLLSLHVCIIMIAYSLLAFTWLNSLTALVTMFVAAIRRPADSQERPNGQELPAVDNLSSLNQQLLLPALACLAAGIFIGAIWANVSWGTYWSWDPKETWALITLLVYSVPVHRGTLPWFRHPRHFHLYMVLAFLSILMTYFGVNFFLGGMHSYA